MLKNILKISVIFLLTSYIFQNFLVAQETTFPLPSSLVPAVNFWKDIYAKYTTNQGVLHDSEDLDIIYQVVDFSKCKSRRCRRRTIKNARNKYKKILRKLATNYRKPETLNSEEKKILRLFGNRATKRRLRQSRKDIRFQLGQKNRFVDGIKRSGMYINEMKPIFNSYGLPEDLVLLPNVESSFNYKAYSKFGAAGLWQFTRSTGRRFLQIDSTVDDRLDPVKSTIAAAKLLKINYKELGAWPLAITAYNHGLAGMKRAVRIHKTKDMGTIIKKYEGRVFGFASKNFYVEFLAAREIYKNYEKYFGKLKLHKPAEYDVFVLKDFVFYKTLKSYLKFNEREFKNLNKSLRPAVFRNQKRIPKGYTFKIKKGSLEEVKLAYLKIPAKDKYSKQVRTQWYKVRRGDTLIKIARKFEATVTSLKYANFLRGSRIYAGQVLKIPTTTYVAMRKEKKTKKTKKEPVKVAYKAPKKVKKEKIVLKSKKQEKVIKKGERYGHIIVDIDETLGHFAEWLSLPTWRLRRLNGLSYRKNIRIGQKIKVDFSKVAQEKFEEMRNEYHRGIEEDFTTNYKVTETFKYKLQSGETLWQICYRKFEVPLWLIKEYNENFDLANIHAGDEITVPVIVSLKDGNGNNNGNKNNGL